MLIEAKLKNNSFKVFRLEIDYSKEDLISLEQFLKPCYEANLTIPIFKTLDGKQGDYIILKSDCCCKSYDIYLGGEVLYFVIIDNLSSDIKFEFYNENEFKRYYE